MKYTVGETAAMKVLLHAARHPSTYISGLLLASKATSRVGQEVQIVDAVPLFHTNSIVGPYFESAIVQVLAGAEKKGQEVVGYYEADPRIRDPELSSVGSRVGERLLANGSSACVFVVDNTKFGHLLRHEAGLPFEIYVKGADRWKRAIAAGEATLSCTCAHISQVLNGHLSSRKHYALSDFDDHLDELTRDWWNVKLAV